MSDARYQLPATTDLTKVGLQLREAYTRSNQQRLDFFSLYDYFVKNAPTDQQVQLLIFEFELIEQTYKRISPEESKGWWNTGSQIYTKLHQLLGDISIEERLIKINQLRHYVEDKLSFDATKSDTWPTNEKLLKDIDQVIKHIVQVKEKMRIRHLLHTMPDLTALQNNIKGIYDGYHSATTGRMFENPKRESSLAFINFVASTSDDIYGTAYRDKSRDENEKDLSYMEAYNIHRGMILYALMQIKDEYKNYWPMSPHRSALFNECLDAMGYTSVDEITIDDKINWLRALSKHLDEVRRIKSRLKGSDTKKTAYDELIEQWQSRKLSDLAAIKLDIEGKIFELEQIKLQPSFIVSTAKSATSAAAAYGIQRIAVSYVAQYAIVPAITTSLAGVVAGPVGMVVGGMVGPFIAYRIGRLVTEKLIPTAVANLCATLLERIGTKLGDAAAFAAFQLFSLSANGVQRLLGYYKAEINDNFEEEWINTLLELPDDLVTAKDKQKIRKIRGLPEPQANLPDGKIPKSIIHSPIKFHHDYDYNPASKSVMRAPIIFHEDYDASVHKEEKAESSPISLLY